MDISTKFIAGLSRLDPGFVATVEKRLTAIPFIRRSLDHQYEKMLGDLESSLKPYRANFPTYTHLPETGIDRAEILRQIEALEQGEEARWEEGYASGAVYHGDAGHVDFLNRVYALTSQSNPLHADIWPSIAKFEAEIVSMAGQMLGATAASGASLAPGDSAEVCGAVTSGGTESILLAMKTYRDWARDRKGIVKPEVILPVTAHAAFDKAAEYFGLTLRRMPVGAGFRVDVDAVRHALTRDTVAIVGSAPCFPYGAVDPILELSELARQHSIGCHVDACLGGFVLPWAERLGYPVPAFDFRLPGVTSISVDTHKYGYAAKGSSVVLYRGPALRRYQYYTVADWPGGLYFSPTLAGSRPGALSAACWAAMLSMGEQGYLEATRNILETAALIKTGIQHIPDLEILGDPLWVIAFGSRTLDIYKIMERMSERGWSLNGLHRPPAVHLCVTLRHTQPGVAVRFLADLEASIAEVREFPDSTGVMAPVYGMAASLPLRGVVGDLLKRYVDVLYRT